MINKIWIPLIGIIFILLYIISLCLPGETLLELELISNVALFFNIGVLLLLQALRKLTLPVLLINVSNLLNVTFFINHLFTSRSTQALNYTYQIDMLLNLDAIFYLYLVIPISSLIYVLFSTQQLERISLLKEYKNPTLKLKIFSLFFAFLIIIKNLANATSGGGAVAYFSIIAYGALLLFPFWVGYWNTKLGKIIFPICLFGISLDIVLTVLTGNRFGAFLDISLLYIGYFVPQNRQVKRTMIIAGIAALPVLFTVIGVMGVVRDKIGRISIADSWNEDRLNIYLEAFSQYFSGANEKDSDLDDEIAKNGSGRNVNWVNISVVSMSPEKVPFRGTDNLDEEFFSVFGISGLQSGFDAYTIRMDSEEKLRKGIGNGMARQYGYWVTPTNGVEWSVLSDGWSRGGFYGAVIYILFVIYFGNFILFFLRSMKRENYLILSIVLINQLVISINVRSIYDIFRDLILRLILIYLIIIVIDFISSNITFRSKNRFAKIK